MFESIGKGMVGWFFDLGEVYVKIIEWFWL